MNAKTIFGLLRDTFQDWSKDKAPRLGAALAYYAIFSIGPLMVATIGIAGFIFGSAAAQGQIVGSISGVVGTDGAKFVQGMIQSASEPKTGIIATVVGLVTLLLGASGIFGQLKDALNTIWEVQAAPSKGIMGAITGNLLKFAMVMGAGALLLASLVINAVLATLGTYINDNLGVPSIVFQLINYAATLAIISLMFGLIFKFLPDVTIGWKEALAGGAVTSFLFVLGQIALGIYLSLAKVGSAFGASASLVVILVWIYYSAQILLLGAEFTQVYANRYGSGVKPRGGATFITEEARAQQGVAGSKRKDQAARRDKSRGRVAGKSPWFS